MSRAVQKETLSTFTYWRGWTKLKFPGKVMALFMPVEETKSLSWGQCLLAIGCWYF